MSWFDAKLISKNRLSPEVYSLEFEIGSMGVFDFTPGQFVVFDLPIGERRLERWRSYSISSAPSQNNRFGLCIGRLSDGKGSQYLCDSLEPGMVLKGKGPQGAFYIPKDNELDLVMICTGTGVAPFRSMIMSMNRPSFQIDLIYGTRNADNLLFEDEWKAKISQGFPLKYHPILSRAPLNGRQGYVHSVYEELFAQNPNGKLYMLCGWQNMVDEAVAKLKVMGVEERLIKYELYG